MKYSKHAIYLDECGYRELGYFNGLQAFLGPDTLITVEELPSGYRVTIDSTVRNVGVCYFAHNSQALIQILEEYINEN